MDSGSNIPAGVSVGNSNKLSIAAPVPIYGQFAQNAAQALPNFDVPEKPANAFRRIALECKAKAEVAEYLAAQIEMDVFRHDPAAARLFQDLMYDAFLLLTGQLKDQRK